MIRQKNMFAAAVESAALRYTIKASTASIASIASIVCVGATIFALLLFLLRVKPGPIVGHFWHAPGKVLLFPCRTSHSRKFPQRHSFSYSYLAVGVPVGFEGNTGGMVSVEASDKSKPGSRGWFTVDAEDHLERGKPKLGLREKLHDYLRAQVSRWLRHGY